MLIEEFIELLRKLVPPKAPVLKADIDYGSVAIQGGETLPSGLRITKSPTLKLQLEVAMRPEEFYLIIQSCDQ